MRYLIGIGTYTAFDDSIGLRIVEHIAEEGLEVDFEVVDMGGSLVDLVHYLGPDTRSVLLVDSARMGRDPGEYAFFQPEQVESTKELANFSSHEGDLLKILSFAALFDRLPEITIMGIEPAETGEGVGLSPQLEARFDEYVAAAVGFFAPPQ